MAQIGLSISVPIWKSSITKFQQRDLESLIQQSVDQQCTVVEWTTYILKIMQKFQYFEAKIIAVEISGGCLGPGKKVDLICVSDFNWLSTYKYKRHSRAICSQWQSVSMMLVVVYLANAKEKFWRYIYGYKYRYKFGYKYRYKCRYKYKYKFGYKYRYTNTDEAGGGLLGPWQREALVHKGEVANSRGGWVVGVREAIPYWGARRLRTLSVAHQTPQTLTLHLRSCIVIRLAMFGFVCMGKIQP